MTITVDDHAASTVNPNTPWYIIESARSGEYITDEADGIPTNSSDYADLTSTQSQRYTIVSTNNFIEGTVATGSATDLRLAIDLSGSGTTSGATINVQVTASQDDFDTTIQKQDYTISVVAMQPPDLVPSDFSSGDNLNTNGARPSNNLILVSITDPQSYGINHSTWTFTPNAGQALEAVQNGGADSYYVRTTANLASRTYRYTSSISNDRGFAVGELKEEFTIAQAGVDTLGGDTNSFIIESSTGSGAQIKEDTDGRTGNQADLDVAYGGTGYNGAGVTDFTSSNAFIAVTSTGLLSVTGDVSGSYVSGDPAITSNINWQDQYGNIGGPTAITVNIAQNTAPSATITPVSPTLNAPLNSGTKLADVSIADTESDIPYNLSLTGADAASLVAFPTNANSSSYEIRLAGNVNNGVTYTYNAVVKDNYGSTQTYSSQTLEVGNVPSLYYAYLVDLGAYASSVSTTIQMYGDASDNGSYSDGSVLDEVADGKLGDTEIVYGQWSASLGISKAYLIGSGSKLTGSNANILLEGVNMATGSENNSSLMIVFPSSSATAADFTLASSMNRSGGSDSTAGMFTMFADRPGTGIGDGPQPSLVRYFDFAGANTYPNSGGSRFGAIMTYGDTSADINYFYMAASSSNPSNSQLMNKKIRYAN